MSADVGATLRVTVTAANGGGSSQGTSAVTAVVPVVAPTDLTSPTISGTAVVGATLTSSPGAWSGSPTAYAYQWARCGSTGTCASIAGATSATYVPTSSDVSSSLLVIVMATNVGGTSSAQSTATASVVSSPSTTSGAWWASSSPFNTAIPATGVLDPNSQSWVNMLYNSTSVNSIWVNSTAWTTTVYHANSSTPTVTVSIGNTGKHINIPFKSGWVTSPDSDAHIAIINDSNGCEYEFQAFSVSSLSSHAAAVFHIDSGSGAHAADAGVTGGEMSVAAGLITPADVASGAINHVLRMGTPVNSSAYRAPATRSDGSLAGGIPEGALIRLDPNLDLSSYGLTSFQLMLAHALQRYGAYNDDNTGSLTVYAESTSDGSSYALPVTGLPKSLVLKLQVMAPLYSSVQLDTNTTSGCNTPY